MLTFIKNIFNRIFSPTGTDYTPDIEDAGRRKIFVIFLFLLIIPFIIFGAYLILVRSLYVYGIINYVLSLVFLVFIIILKRLRNPGTLYRIVLLLISILFLYWTNIGAFKGYTSIWLLALPPFTYYLLGKREGTCWTIIIVVITALFFTFPELSLRNYAYDKNFSIRHIVALLLIVLFTYNYEAMRQRYKDAMDEEQDNLKKEKDMLASAKTELEDANRRLNDEMSERKRMEHELLKHRDMLEDIVAERTNEIKSKNRELESSEKKFRLLADNINEFIWSSDLSFRYTFASPSVTRIFGYTVDEAMELTFDKWNTPESFHKVLKIFDEQINLEKAGSSDPSRHIVVQLEHIKKDGSVIPVEVTASFIRNENGIVAGIAGITRDISDRIKAQIEKEKMQEQLLQAQKMEAIGTLVSGVAHDFNNILGGIMGSFEMLQQILSNENLVKRDKINKYLDLGMESSRRSADLIRQLLALSKKHEIKLSPININESLMHIHELCKNSLPKSVELEFKIESEPLMIMGDVVQIEQVLLNLCINASHAMTVMRPEGSKQGGVLSVSAEEVRDDLSIKELYPESAGHYSDWIRIQVSDTGVGMEQETKKRIFEPFFTTKRQNEGSGLGLSISYNIIQKHGGLIHIYSEPGKGSSFSIYIPSYKHGELNENYGACKDELVAGFGKILVVDDEAIMLNIAEGFLEQCGYEVITASNAADGINKYRECHKEIAAVLIDLSMPGMSGIEVYRELSLINPDVRVLLASGMLDIDSERIARNIGIMDTVHKPYMAADLSRKIKMIIEKNSR